ncbi:MAG: hypothetical protein WBA74_23635 [Cyclobacteriaceae bacterium]
MPSRQGFNHKGAAQLESVLVEVMNMDFDKSISALIKNLHEFIIAKLSDFTREEFVL